MTHRKGAVWTERLLLVMILGSLAGTLNLVLTVHRRTAEVFSGPLAQPSAPSPVLLPPAPETARIPRTITTRSSSSKPRTSAPTPAPSPRAVAPVEDPT